MKSIVLFALLNVNGVDYRLNTEFFDTQEQCINKVITCNKRVEKLSNINLQLQLKAKCHKIISEIDETE